MEVRLAVEEVEEPLVVEELGVPLVGLVIAEVVTQRHKQDVASEEPGFLAVLVQEQGCPGVGEGQAESRCYRLLSRASPTGPSAAVP